MAKAKKERSTAPTIKELAKKLRYKNRGDWDELLAASASWIDARDGNFRRLEERARDLQVVLTAEERIFLADIAGQKIKRPAHRQKQFRVAQKRRLAAWFSALALKDGKSNDEIAVELRKKFKRFGIGLEGLSSTVLRELIARLRILDRKERAEWPAERFGQSADIVLRIRSGIKPVHRTEEEHRAWVRAQLEDSIKIAERSGTRQRPIF